MARDGARRLLTWEQYLDQTLPNLLDEAGVEVDAAAAIVADIRRRADDYTNSGVVARRALRVPFYDDVADFDPREAPIRCLANVAVVVRNSLLEHAHANGPLTSDHLAQITYLASDAFNAWLLQQPEVADDAPPAGVFAPVAAYPRAKAALRALADAARNGGRQSFRMPDGPVPTLPEPGKHEITAAGQIRRSAIAAVDEVLLQQLTATAANEMDFAVCSSLSRASRDSTVIAMVVEFLLAHGGVLLTTNFLIRPGEAFARRPPLIGANSRDPLSAMRTDRLPGLHAKYVRALMKSQQAD